MINVIYVLLINIVVTTANNVLALNFVLVYILSTNIIKVYLLRRK